MFAMIPEGDKTLKEPIITQLAPEAIGTYSQAIKAGNMVFISGQIPLNPRTLELVEGGIKAQLEQVFENLAEVSQASGGSLHHIVKLTVYLTDLSHFADLNEVMIHHFEKPYP